MDTDEPAEPAEKAQDGYSAHMSSRDYSLDLALAERLADAADEFTLSRYQSLDLVIETKPDLTPVTDADKGTEELIRSILASERPGDVVVGEEFGGRDEVQKPGNDKYYWVIDPIDGTKNFVRGVPIWCTLIALMSPDHQVVVGVVSSPALFRRWSAHEGGGAFLSLNGGPKKKISVSAVSQIADASLSYSDLVGWGAKREKFIELQDRIWRTRGVGDFWSHMLVAEGAIDIAVEPSLALWDMAALAVVVTEAGGTFSDLDGVNGPNGAGGLSTNGRLKDAFISSLESK